MKALLKIIIVFGFVFNIKAQSSEKISFKINVNEKSKNALKLKQRVMIDKGLYMDVSPQFGNLFITRFEAIKAKINLKEFYNDFDFSLNMGFNFLLKEQLSFKAIYNIGLLKFDQPESEKSKSCLLSFSIDYVF